jgi:hypothetical protein
VGELISDQRVYREHMRLNRIRAHPTQRNLQLIDNPTSTYIHKYELYDRTSLIDRILDFEVEPLGKQHRGSPIFYVHNLESALSPMYARTGGALCYPTDSYLDD